MIERWWGLEETPNLLRASRILGAAGKLEGAILEGRTPVDRLLAAHIAEKKGAMGSKDRALLGMAAYGLARNRALIVKAAGEGSEPGAALLLALADAIDSRENELAAELSPQLSLLDNLRDQALEIVSSAAGKPLADLRDEERTACTNLFSLSDFWLELGPWSTLKEAAAELNVGKFQQKPQLRCETGLERLLADLADRGIDASPMGRSPWGVTLGGRTRAGALDGLGTEFQDEGSQLASLLCLPLESGSKALDFCAGAGGKGLAIGSRSEAKVYLHDADKRRLERALPRIEKAGRTNIRFCRSPEADGPFDLVIVDAPCSSSGTLRRNPGIASRWTREEALAFPKVQREILERAAALVRPGGTLVYVTCSLFDPENFSVVRGFLQDAKGFSADPPSHPAFEGIPGAEEGAFRLPLNLEGYGGDGFFLSRLKRL